MKVYSFRMLKSQPLRLVITISGISLCIVLMLFLLGIYKGAAEGSVEYVKRNEADLWVIQKSAENILRGTSILNSVQMLQIYNNENIQSVSPVLLVLSTLKTETGSATIFLCGYDLASPLGGPPEIKEGRGIKRIKEIVLDRSFALKHSIKPGDIVSIMDDTLKVTGLSSGTNAFVIQYGFAAIQKVHSIIGFNNIYTCFLIKLNNRSVIQKTKRELEENLPGCSIYSHNEFVENNIREMKSGIMPVLYAIAAISSIVLITILSLILSVSILEKKKEFAVIKVLGCPESFLPKLILSQAVIITLLSSAAGLVLYFPLAELIKYLSPEISLKNDYLTSLAVIISAVLMSVISTVLSSGRLRKIYPAEVFNE